MRERDKERLDVADGRGSVNPRWAVEVMTNLVSDSLQPPTPAEQLQNVKSGSLCVCKCVQMRATTWL